MKQKKMGDSISRKETLKNIEKIRWSTQMMDDTHRADLIMRGIHLCEEAVMHQPSAQQGRKTGHWIEIEDEIITGKCSVCGWDAIFAETDVVGMPYCPNCGADMRGEEG